ncbi:hypothetical protein DL93DRAFT_1648579 [Clavulina sp. PMI_390]|nr:hypothetical protein DL93DRAFT_1648579 [Clavulina sp. PMI_390]
MDQIDRIGVLQAARLVDTELSEHQKGQIHAILTAKTPEKFVTLFSDANHFRPLLVSQIERASDGPPESSTSVQELHVNPTMKTIPPRKAFESVLKEFSNGGLKVAPIIGLSPTDTTAAVFPPPARSDAFGTPDARWRLFTDITHNDILATKNKVFDSRELLYNDHETAWKLFRVIVQDYGDILDASHSNIDWISVSREMGRPYEIDPQFTAYIYTIYYTYVAPIVAFWLWEVYIVMKQQLVASTFAQRWEINLKTFSEPAPSIAEEIPSSAQPSLELPSRISLHSSHKRKPHDTVMHAIHSSFSELNKELYSPLTQEQLDELPLYDPLSYVHKVAVNQKLRAVIRHLPQEPVELLCNVVQWVLDTSQDYFEERRNIIKLLQDLSHALPVGKLPKNLENPFQNPERPWKDGGEAYVIRQKSGEHWFAIRVHKYASMERSEVYLTDKRIKRSIILQRQFHHKNLLETFGISSRTTPNEAV